MRKKIPKKCNAQNAFIVRIKEKSIALVDISWQTANRAKIFTNGDLMFSQTRTTSSRRCDLVVLGTEKLRQRNSISWPTMRGRDVDGIHDRFQRDSENRG